MGDREVDGGVPGGQSPRWGSVVGPDHGDGVCGGRVVWGECARGDLGGRDVGDREVVCH